MSDQEREPWGRAYSRWFVEQYGDRMATPEEVAVFNCAKDYIAGLTEELDIERRKANAMSGEVTRIAEERDALRAERDHERGRKDVWHERFEYVAAKRARLEEALREIARLEGMASASDIARNALSQDTESPRPANCDCGCSPPGPGLHYANCPAATADDTESPEEPA